MPDDLPGRPDVERGDAGLTLVELLVAMALFMAVVTGVYGVMIAVQRQGSDIAGREETVGQARTGLAQMDRQIRSGNVLYSPLHETVPSSCQVGTTPGLDAGPCMRVYTQADGAPRCVQWQAEPIAGVLRTRSWSPTWQTDGRVTDWTVTARGIQPGSMFRLQGGATSSGSRLVDVLLRVRDPRSRGAAQDVQTSLTGRNTQYGYDGGVCTPVPPSA